MKVCFSCISKEGYVIIALSFLVTLILFSFSKLLGAIALVFAVISVYFFRDPERVPPAGDNLVLSPADGLVKSIEDTTMPAELDAGDEEVTKVSIFLSIFDVHVNRIPIAGIVLKSRYHAGKFFNASLDKASKFNERNSILIESKNGQRIGVTQIAGLIARRIVCDVKDSQDVEIAQRFGIIKFGSRVDIYLPKDAEINVLVGQTMIAGETIIATLEADSMSANLLADDTTI